MNCEYCETRILITDRNCPNCGAPVSEIKPKKIIENYDPIDDIIALTIREGNRKFKVGTLWDIVSSVYVIFSYNSPCLANPDWINIKIDDDSILWISENKQRIYANKKGKTKVRVYLKKNEKVSCSIIVTVI